MKIVFLFLVTFFIVQIQAQKSKPKTAIKPKTVAAKPKTVPVKPYKATAADSANIQGLAMDMCGCTKQLTDSLHPVLKDYMIDLSKLGEKEAQKKMNEKVALLDETEKKKFVESSKIFLPNSTIMQNFEKCMADVEVKNEGKMDAPEKSQKEKAYDKILAHYLKTISDCELMEMFYDVGKKVKN